MVDSLQDVMAVPYVLDVSTRRTEAGEWVCRLEYAELPGCVAEARDVFDALERVDELRENWLTARRSAGLPIPSPRAGLRI